MPSAVKRIEREALLAMSDDQIVAEVASILKKVVPEEFGEARLDSRLIEDIGIDSLGTYELVMDAEDRFGIQIADDQLVNVKTVKDVVEFVKSQLE
jgi:acyl carrier protein